MKWTRTIFIFVLLAFVFPIASFAAENELSAPRSLLNGEYDLPVSVSISSPYYKSLARYSNERLNDLNNLLKHFSVSVKLDGNISETSLFIDKEQLYTVSEITDGSRIASVYSFYPDRIFDSAGNDDIESDFIQFLRHQFFYINREMDDLYKLFEKSADVFKEYARSQTENLSYKGYGKAVQRITIPIPAEYVTEHFPEVLSQMAVSEESRILINQLVFKGAQKIVLLYNQDQQILRINYDGIVGFSDESLRKVSLVWRCLRSDDQLKDKITLKTPAIKGYDKYNMTYTREIDLADADNHILLWDFQLDLRNGEEKKKIQYNAELVSGGSEMTGKAVFTEKHDGVENKTTIIPEIRKENGDEYNGVLEITQKKGKIITSMITSRIHVSSGDPLVFPAAAPATGTDLQSGGVDLSAGVLQNKLTEIIISRLMALPAEDLEFLRKDIPDDVWTSIIQLMQ